MLRRRRIWSGAGLLCATLTFGGCATTAVTKGGGAGIEEAQAEAYDGPKARIAVGSIVDKTGGRKKASLNYQLGLLRRHTGSSDAYSHDSVLGGVRDLVSLSQGGVSIDIELVVGVYLVPDPAHPDPADRDDPGQ